MVNLKTIEKSIKITPKNHTRNSKVKRMDSTKAAKFPLKINTAYSSSKNPKSVIKSLNNTSKAENSQKILEFN